MLNLHQQQMDLEMEAIGVYRKKYYEHLAERGPAETGPGQALMVSAIIPLAEALDEWINRTLKMAAINADLYPYLQGTDTRELAALTLRAALQAPLSGQSYVALCGSLGGTVEEHVRWAKLWRDPERSAYLREAVRRMEDLGQDENRRRARVRRVLAALDPTYFRWSIRVRAQVGAHLLERMITTTGLFQKVTYKVGRSNRSYTELTAVPELLEKLEQGHEYASVLKPTSFPMVVPPLEWTSLVEGGQLSRCMGLVKHAPYVHGHGQTSSPSQQVLDAVNALQRVPWRINKGLYAIVERAWEEDWRCAGLPRRDIEDLPPKPVDIETNRESRRAWSRSAKAVHVRNHRSQVMRITVAMQVTLARRFVEYERFYYPHQMDWRGRVYPVAGHLHPQGDDLSRALLEFSEGKPIGPDGGYWLAVHIANCYGHDKLPLDERVQWVHQHASMVRTCGLFPEENIQDWEVADKPWCFLAACQEWVGYELMGEEHETHLPVHVDGSCNGLQHLAAMQRDPSTARLVNLLPSTQPADVYTDVAKAVEAMLEDSDHEHAEVARAWLQEGIPRKIVKRPVMTVPYGVTRHGMRAQIMGELNSMFPAIKGEASQIATVLSELTWDAVADVITGARLVMDWLQQCAEVAAEHGCGLQWETPMGFAPLQHYYEMDGDRLNLYIGGRRVQLTLATASNTLNKRKQTLGIAPNVVHSFDASHLLDTVLLCGDHDIHQFAAVHDSYACLAPDMPVLNHVLRESFVAHYQVPVLAELYNQFQECLPEGVELPAPPALGDLDVQQVMESPYFFS